MPKPTTVKLTGMFEVKESVSLKDLQEALAAAEEIVQRRIGPGSLVLKIGRQELQA